MSALLTDGYLILGADGLFAISPPDASLKGIARASFGNINNKRVTPRIRQRG